MKKLISLLTAFLLLALPLFAFAEEDADALRITSTVPAEELTITHTYASQYFRSSAQFVLVGEQELQLTFTLWTDAGFLNVTSATITVAGESFLFEGIGNPDMSIYSRPSYMEVATIVFDETHDAFLSALMVACQFPEEGAAPCQVVLHGVVDEEITLGTGFAADFLTLYALYTGDETLAPIPAEDEAPIVDEAPVVDEAPTAEETKNDGSRYIVVDASGATVKDRAAIRFDPSISSAVLKYAYTGEVYRVRGELAEWYFIDVDGKYGYIHKGVANILE